MSGCAKDDGVIKCGKCGAINSAELTHCERCGSPVFVRRHRCVEKTLALIFTSLVLYIPANVLPIMVTYRFGSASESTILGGVVSLWNHGDFLIASIIFFASVVIPLAKIIILGFLCISVIQGSTKSLVAKTRLYELTEFLGKWSMIDVFVVVVLVTLVQVGNIMAIHSGPGVVAFAGVVVTTMLAAEAFDPKLIWDRADKELST